MLSLAKLLVGNKKVKPNTKYEKQLQKNINNLCYNNNKTNTRLIALCPELPGWAGTRKVKPI